MRYNKLQESMLYDHCCGDRPKILPYGQDYSQWLVECKICGDGVEGKDLSELLIEWNKKKRKKK